MGVLKSHFFVRRFRLLGIVPMTTEQQEHTKISNLKKKVSEKLAEAERLAEDGEFEKSGAVLEVILYKYTQLSICI